MTVDRLSKSEVNPLSEVTTGWLGAINHAKAVLAEAEKAKGNGSGDNGGMESRQASVGTEGAQNNNVLVYTPEAITKEEQINEHGEIFKYGQEATDYIRKNQTADAMSLDAVKDAGTIQKNWSEISGGKDYITADDMRAYANSNPDIKPELREALMFWSDRGMAKQLDSAGENRALTKDDKLIGKNNLEDWISKEAPKNAAQFANLLDSAATDGLTANVDVSKIGADVFQHPENYTAEQRAAVLHDLIDARASIETGVQGGLWSTSKDGDFMTRKAHVSPDSAKLTSEVDGHIAALQEMPDVQKFLSEGKQARYKELLENSPEMKADLQDYYDNKVKSGDALDDMFAMKASKSKDIGVPASVAGFTTQATVFHSVLGLEGQPDLRAMVHASDHGGQVDSYYRDNIVSAKDYQALLDSGVQPDVAMASFGVEVANFNAIADPALVESLRGELSQNFGKAVIDQQFKGTTAEDLGAIIAKPDGSFDEERAKQIFGELAQSSPELFVDQFGKNVTADQVVSGIRNVWDSVRQGAKVSDAMAKLDFLPKYDNTVSRAYGAGTMHLVSGFLAGSVTVARGMKTSGKTPTPSEIAGIVGGSATTLGVLTEGGVKAYMTNNSGTVKMGKMSEARYSAWEKRLKGYESGGKLLGGSSNVLTGVFGIVSGVSDIKSGNLLSGGLNVTSGGLSTVAGVLSGGEALASLFGAPARVVAGLAAGAGAFGFLSAGLGAGITVWQIVEDVKRDKAAYKYADTVDAYLGHYGINGNGGQPLAVPESTEAKDQPKDGRSKHNAF